MGVSYQTRNRLRRKVQTAPLSAIPTVLEPKHAPAPQPAHGARFAWWPMAAAAAVAISAFAFVYRP